MVIQSVFGVKKQDSLRWGDAHRYMYLEQLGWLPYERSSTMENRQKKTEDLGPT